MSTGHVPRWPGYRAEPVERSLAILDPRDTWEEVKYNLFAKNQLLLTDSLQTYLEDAINDPRCDTICDRSGRLRSIHVWSPGKRAIRGREARWIVPSTTWGYAAASGRMLRDLRALFAHAGQGVHASPSGLGQALMRAEHWARGLPQASFPGYCAQESIRKHMCGGRADFIRAARVAVAWMYDLSNAYALHYVKQPTGTAIRVLSERDYDCATWFRQAVVRLPRNVSLGAFPLRLGARICYPADRGDYGIDQPLWLWREQGDDVQAVGGHVQWGPGWMWRTWLDNSTWTQTAIMLRQAAPTPEVESLVKNIIVAGIGRHGMRSETITIVPEAARRPGDIPLAGTLDCPMPAYWVRRAEEWRGGSMMHWFAYTIMQCARTLYHKALPVAERSELLATDYDAIYSLGRYSMTGSWKEERVTDVRIVANRHIAHATRVKMPGIPEGDPRRWDWQ